MFLDTILSLNLCSQYDRTKWCSCALHLLPGLQEVATFSFQLSMTVMDYDFLPCFNAVPQRSGVAPYLSSSRDKKNPQHFD